MASFALSLDVAAQSLPKIGILLENTDTECRQGLELARELLVKDLKSLQIIERKIELEPESAANEYLRLINDERVSVVLGPLSRTLMASLWGIVGANNTPHIFLGEGMPSWRGKMASNVFLIRPDILSEASALVSFAHRVTKAKKPALFVETSSEERVAWGDGVSAALRTRGYKNIIVQKFLSEKVDLSESLRALHVSGVDAVFVSAPVVRVRSMVTQAQAMGFKVPFYVREVSWYDHEVGVDTASPVGHFVVSRMSQEDPHMGFQDFRKRHHTKYGTWPTTVVLDCYESLLFAGHALKNKKANETLLRSIQRLKNFSAPMGPRHIDKNGAVSRALIIQETHSKNLRFKQRTAD